MCIRDRRLGYTNLSFEVGDIGQYVTDKEIDIVVSLHACNTCLLYTSDAADDLLCVDLGGRRIIKQKNRLISMHSHYTTIYPLCTSTLCT